MTNDFGTLEARRICKQKTNFACEKYIISNVVLNIHWPFPNRPYQCRLSLRNVPEKKCAYSVFIRFARTPKLKDKDFWKNILGKIWKILENSETTIKITLPSREGHDDSAIETIRQKTTKHDVVPRITTNSDTNTTTTCSNTTTTCSKITSTSGTRTRHSQWSAHDSIPEKVNIIHDLTPYENSNENEQLMCGPSFFKPVPQTNYSMSESTNMFF